MKWENSMKRARFEVKGAWNWVKAKRIWKEFSKVLKNNYGPWSKINWVKRKRQVRLDALRYQEWYLNLTRRRWKTSNAIWGFLKPAIANWSSAKRNKRDPIERSWGEETSNGMRVQGKTRQRKTRDGKIDYSTTRNWVKLKRTWECIKAKGRGALSQDHAKGDGVPRSLEHQEKRVWWSQLWVVKKRTRGTLKIRLKWRCDQRAAFPCQALSSREDWPKFSNEIGFSNKTMRAVSLKTFRNKKLG